MCLIVYIQLCVKDPTKICVSFFRDLRTLESARKSLFLGVFKLKRSNGQRPQSVGEKWSSAVDNWSSYLSRTLIIKYEICWAWIWENSRDQGQNLKLSCKHNPPKQKMTLRRGSCNMFHTHRTTNCSYGLGTTDQGAVLWEGIGVKQILSWDLNRRIVYKTWTHIPAQRCIEFHAPSYNEDVEKLDTAHRGAIKKSED